jgi:hypothetical protein
MGDIIGQNEQLFEVHCNRCIHYLGWGKCKAFPNRIPKLILLWKIPHDKVFNSQVGDFIFEGGK